MKALITFALSIIVTSCVIAQGHVQADQSTAAADAIALQQWLENLYEVGVIAQHDTFTVTAEAKRVATDSVLRRVIYADHYNWPEAQYLLKNMHIKIGLWHLINLYDDDETSRQAVLKYISGLGQLFDMKKALTASFYTYIFFDPEACQVIDGKPVFHRPDILDEKLDVVRSILRQLPS